ncbi:DUF502 domain-containing protein [Aquicella lusitana]|uniref:Putative membrane protein n=1 Tax=Aquicella lusitana TaxID=254246 RepID=A0A370GDR3_9COXI|nr:DUF502 domain-containing protein [Aquicella lusitana]RDI41831.1 putative membrane protein [Aquicella lusitana]VVC73739.1 hypothetical protein AQULUS_14880 [Aquicella lusitana]
MIAYLRTCFISGLLVWLPIWVTLLVIKFLVDLLSRSLLLLPPHYQPDALLGFHVPGIGVLVTLVVIFLTGVVAANFIGRRLVDFGDAIVGRIPVVRSIYTGVKQVTHTLFTPGGQSFRKVLLVQYPCEGVWSIAFQTGEVVKEMEGPVNQGPMVSYFIPTTPNPTSGFLMMAPKSKVIELDMSVDQALKFVISLGVVQPGMGTLANNKKK